MQSLSPPLGTALLGRWTRPRSVFGSLGASLGSTGPGIWQVCARRVHCIVTYTQSLDSTPSEPLGWEGLALSPPQEVPGLP